MRTTIAIERPWLTELLVCPACSTPLAREDEALTCSNGHRHEIVEGIPRFVPPSSYADSFGYQWRTFRTTQLDDDGRTASADAFTRKTGLGPADLEGATVLDAGCGMGRYADVAARLGAARVVAADLTAAVDSAATNLRVHPNAATIQADVRSLPFRADTFDVVFSIGALHHTPSSFESLSRIAPLVKPGGTLALWVYSKHLARLFAGGELLRPLTSRMPADKLLATIRAVQPRVTALKRSGPRVTRLLDLILPTSNHSDPEWQVLETFDWYSPRYHNKHTYPEVEGWFNKLGFTETTRLPEPVAIRGRKVEGSP